jgi:C1A family cysteine protease
MREAVDETSTFTLAENQFSDWTQEEYRSILGYRRFESDADIEVVKQEVRSLEALEIPASVDWRNSNAVTTVKDQGQCGSCWSFSTTGTIEGAYAQKYGNLLSFSEQQFVDCDFP